MIITNRLGHTIEIINPSSLQKPISWNPIDALQNEVYILSIETQDG